jgi:hypothetical protein
MNTLEDGGAVLVPDPGGTEFIHDGNAPLETVTLLTGLSVMLGRIKVASLHTFERSSDALFQDAFVRGVCLRHLER